MSFFIGRVLPSLLASLLALATAPADVSLDAGDTIVCYGNSMVERLCEHGELEAMIQLAQPEKKLQTGKDDTYESAFVGRPIRRGMSCHA